MNIAGYQPVSLCDFEGHVAAVIFTQGCNFRCPFCHNAALIPVQVEAGRPIPEQDVLDRLFLRRGRIDGVVVSGGEPTLQPDLADFLSAVREMEFAVKLDTNGSRPEVLRALLGAGLLDYVAMDVKAPWRKYEIIAGVPAATERIAESVRIVAGSGMSHEFRTTMVPGLLEEDDLAAIRATIPPGSRHKRQAFRDSTNTDRPAPDRQGGRMRQLK